MTRARMILPPYADTELGRELLAAIIASPPELGPDSYRLPSTFGGHREPCVPNYRDKPAARLRRLEREWKEREFAKLPKGWAYEDAAHVMGVETANELIERVLRDAARKAAA